MKKSSLGILCILSVYVSGFSQQPAFPGAEGWGKYTTGGRGGDVYIVTNLNDSGPGSLRDAVSKSHRTIVFETSGTISLKSPLTTADSITIAGQTAPGDGICIKGYPFVIKHRNNIIIRFLRIRLGDENNLKSDAFCFNFCNDVIVDHLSVSWGVDECMSPYGNTNATVQWCIIGEGLNYQKHSAGGLWGGNSTYHHNLIHTCGTRHPKYAYTKEEEIADSRNNVVYNWGKQSAYTNQIGKLNLVANFYKPGPSTLENVKHRFIMGDSIKEIFVKDNYMSGFPEITIDNWNGGVDGNYIKASEPFSVPYQIKTESAEVAYQQVLLHSGAFLPKRDAVDARVIQQVIEGTGKIIDRQWEVGGYPELKSIPAPVDSDRDGMPDDWERSHNLNIHDPADRNGDYNKDGYTNLEDYLNSLVILPGDNIKTN
jgi:pectate lyase